MTDKCILLIDMDGVTSDWTGRVLDVYKERYPDRELPDRSEVKQFYLEESFDADYQEDVLAITREAGFYDSLEIIEGAKKALIDIQVNCGDFIEPYLCSSPELVYDKFLCHSEKAAWVERILGPWWTDRLVLTRDKTLVRGHVLIDDKPSIKGIMAPTWRHMVYDQPYNRDVQSNGGRFTWKDWDALREVIRETFAPHTIIKPEESRILLLS